MVENNFTLLYFMSKKKKKHLLKYMIFTKSLKGRTNKHFPTHAAVETYSTTMKRIQIYWQKKAHFIFFQNIKENE